MLYDWDKNQRHSSARINFVRNAWEPIAIPRWAVSLKYAMFVIVGALTFILGLPTLSLYTFTGYEPIWAGFVALGGVIGFVGSLRPLWGWLEALGGFILVAFLAVLILALCLRGSTTVALLLGIVCIVPTVRSVFLLAHYNYRRRGVI